MMIKKINYKLFCCHVSDCLIFRPFLSLSIKSLSAGRILQQQIANITTTSTAKSISNLGKSNPNLQNEQPVMKLGDFRFIPIPREPINTVELFLKTIGRGCDAHIDKFTSWESLFNTPSQKMKSLGINVRERKWILLWVNKYCLGIDPYYIPPSKKSVEKGKWKL